MQNRETDREGADVCINEKGNIESHKSKIIPSEEPNLTTGKAVKLMTLVLILNHQLTALKKSPAFPARRKMWVQGISTKAQTGASQTELSAYRKPLPRYETPNMSNKYSVNLKNLEGHMLHPIEKQIVDIEAKDTYKNIPVMERTWNL